MNIKRWMMKVPVWHLSLCLLGSVLGTMSAKADQENLNQVAFVAAGIRDAREKAWCARATVKTTTVVPNEFYRTIQSAGVPSSSVVGDQQTTRVAWWYLQGRKLAMTVQPVGANEESSESLLRYQKIVADEKEVRILGEFADRKKGSAPDRFVYRLGTISRPEEILFHSLWRVHEDLDPRFFAYHYDKKPLDHMLADATLQPSYHGEELIEGSRCKKIELQLSKEAALFIWIDIEHGYLMRKANVYLHFKDKKPIRIQEICIPRLVESGDIYLPALVEMKTSVPIGEVMRRADGTFDMSRLPIQSNRIKIEEGVAFTPAIAKRVEISEFSFGSECQMPPDIFTLYWPLNTEITNEIKHQVYFVRMVSADESSSHLKESAVPDSAGVLKKATPRAGQAQISSLSSKP